MIADKKDIEKHLPEWAVLVRLLYEEAKQEHETLLERKKRELFL